MSINTQTWVFFIVLLSIIRQTVSFDFFGLLQHDPDIDRNVSELITSKGYPVENHYVTSDDGYTIGIQRIPHGKKGKRGSTNRKTILVLHGILETSADWVSNFPDSSLGFILADNGYDVWLGNYRGNTYGQKHANLSVKDNQFWAFTIDQQAKYDMPAFVNYIKKVTGQPKIHFCGFSLAASIMLAFLANKPEHNDMVESVVLIAPAVYFKHFTAPSGKPVVILADSSTALGIDTYGLFQGSDFNREISKTICGNSITRHLCNLALYFISGKPSDQLNETRLAVYLAHTPSATSLRQLKHAVQMSRKKVFTKFDFGSKENLLQYGQNTAPTYNLSAVKVPIAFISALTDEMVGAKDVALLKSQLKAVYASHIITRMWNHLDNVWGKDANVYVYPKVLQYLSEKKT